MNVTGFDLTSPMVSVQMYCNTEWSILFCTLILRIYHLREIKYTLEGIMIKLGTFLSLAGTYNGYESEEKSKVVLFTK